MCLPPLEMLKCRRRSNSSRTFESILGVTVYTVVTILSVNSGIVRGLVAYTLSLMNPHRKNPKGVRSGDRGGQEIGPARPIQLLGNTSSSKSRMRIA